MLFSVFVGCFFVLRFSVGYFRIWVCGWLFLDLLFLVWCFKFLGDFVVCGFVV